MFQPRLRPATGLLVLLLAACSPAPQDQSANAQQSAQDQRAQDDLKLYQGLIAKGSFELAAPIGEGVLQRAPDSAAAAEIRETLPEAQAKAKEINNQRRLANLWLYQANEQSGGQQTTATLYPSRPASAHNRIRLVLRRHTDWGQSVYLYDTGNEGFICKGTCNVALKIDGEPATALEASLPDTSDPAMFIDSDKRLLQLLETAKTLELTANIKGIGSENLYFEVGGFDPERWPEPEKPGKNKPD